MTSRKVDPRTRELAATILDVVADVWWDADRRGDPLPIMFSSIDAADALGVPAGHSARELAKAARMATRVDSWGPRGVAEDYSEAAARLRTGEYPLT